MSGSFGVMGLLDVCAFFAHFYLHLPDRCCCNRIVARHEPRDPKSSHVGESFPRRGGGHYDFFGTARVGDSPWF